MTGRIRWDEPPSGTICGYVGTLKSWAFQIYHQAPALGSRLALMSQLPGLGGTTLAWGDKDELQLEAEMLLERFAVTLGAVFPAAGDDEPAVSPHRQLAGDGLEAATWQYQQWGEGSLPACLKSSRWELARAQVHAMLAIADAIAAAARRKGGAS